MKQVLLISLLLLLAGQADANSYFKVVDISPIKVAPNSEANFTVTLRSAGGSGAFAEPMFDFNFATGLSAEAPGGLRYIVATGNRIYNCTIKAGNISPGNYSFRIGVYAQDAPYSWRAAYAIVESPKEATKAPLNVSFSNSSNDKTNEGELIANKTAPAKIPGPGVLLAIAAAIIASRRARR